MLQDLENRAKKAYSTIKNNIKPKIIGTILAGALTYGTNDAQAQRIITIDVDPASRGYAEETINLTNFEVRYYTIPEDTTKIGYAIRNKTNPEQYLETRGITNKPTQEQTTTIDGIAALPTDGITQGENLGSLAPNAEIPGSQPGRDLGEEVQSSLYFGAPYIIFPSTQEREFWFDLDSIQTEAMQQKVQNTINSWNQGKTRAEYNTFHSNQETPPGYEPGMPKVWIVEGVQNVHYNGEIDIGESIIRLNRWAANQSTCDEEIFSAMLGTYLSPFYNQELPIIPQTYLKMFDIQNFSEIENQGELTFVAFGGIGYPGPAIYYPGADDGTGTFPESINEQNLITKKTLDENGSATTNLDEIITNTPQTTMHMTISNYPNPFNGTTNITYTIPEETKVNITIYDIKGRKIQEIKKETMSAGTHQTQWKTNENTPSGTYIYKITTNKETKTGKTTITK